MWDMHLNNQHNISLGWGVHLEPNIHELEFIFYF